MLNRDLEHWDIVHAYAKARGLRVIHYGTQPECDVYLESRSALTKEVQIQVGASRYRYPLGISGRHMALNSMACIAVALALELPLEPMLAQFSLFRPVLQAEPDLVFVCGKKVDAESS